MGPRLLSSLAALSTLILTLWYFIETPPLSSGKSIQEILVTAVQIPVEFWAWVGGGSVRLVIAIPLVVFVVRTALITPLMGRWFA